MSQAKSLENLEARRHSHEKSVGTIRKLSHLQVGGFAALHLPLNATWVKSGIVLAIFMV